MSWTCCWCLQILCSVLRWLSLVGFILRFNVQESDSRLPVMAYLHNHDDLHFLVCWWVDNAHEWLNSAASSICRPNLKAQKSQQAGTGRSRAEWQQNWRRKGNKINCEGTIILIKIIKGRQSQVCLDLSSDMSLSWCIVTMAVELPLDTLLYILIILSDCRHSARFLTPGTLSARTMIWKSHWMPGRHQFRPAEFGDCIPAEFVHWSFKWLIVPLNSKSTKIYHH